MPLTTSSPASIASQIGAIHCGEILPPTGAIPISIERAPCATASVGVRRGKPMSTRKLVPFMPRPRGRVWKPLPKSTDWNATVVMLLV